MPPFPVDLDYGQRETERLYCVLGIIVVPRNSVVIEEREQLISILLESLLVADSHSHLESLLGNQIVKLLD